MTEDEIRGRNEERRAKLDAVSRRNMESVQHLSQK